MKSAPRNTRTSVPVLPGRARCGRLCPAADGAAPPWGSLSNEVPASERQVLDGGSWCQSVPVAVQELLRLGAASCRGYPGPLAGHPLMRGPRERGDVGREGQAGPTAAQGREEGDGDAVSVETTGVGEEGPLPPGEPGEDSVGPGRWSLEDE